MAMHNAKGTFWGVAHPIGTLIADFIPVYPFSFRLLYTINQFVNDVQEQIQLNLFEFSR
jgi:hypothetical protein